MSTDLDKKVAAYNEALAVGSADASRLADDLLREIFDRIMADDEYQRRQR
jgi:hypothetical protein